jgi:hypothetical protein
MLDLVRKPSSRAAVLTLLALLSGGAALGGLQVGERAGPQPVARDRAGGDGPKQAVASTSEAATSTPAAKVETTAQRPVKGHVLYAEVPADNESPANAILEEALRIEGRDELRERDVLGRVRELLAGDPSSEHLDVRCGQSFCRLQIERTHTDGMPWHEIDDALRPLSSGETIIQTDANGAIGYVYFAEDNARLPL